MDQTMSLGTHNIVYNL